MHREGARRAAQRLLGPGAVVMTQGSWNTAHTIIAAIPGGKTFTASGPSWAEAFAELERRIYEELTKGEAS